MVGNTGTQTKLLKLLFGDGGGGGVAAGLYDIGLLQIVLMKGCFVDLHMVD
jgi:hypothetical protein